MSRTLLQSIRLEDGLKVIDLEAEMGTYDLLGELFHNETVCVGKDTSVTVTKSESSRYFGDSTVCYRCGSTGHTSRKCDASFEQNCVFCSLYHPSAPCDYLFCYNCRHFGHREKSCREKRAPRLICKECTGQLHYSVDCPRPWRSYKLLNLAVSPGFRMSCAYCYSTGHFIDDCKMKDCRISIFTKNYKALARSRPRTEGRG